MYLRPQSQMMAPMRVQMTQTIMFLCELVFLCPINGRDDVVNGVTAVRRHVHPSMTSIAVRPSMTVHFLIFL